MNKQTLIGSLDLETSKISVNLTVERSYHYFGEDGLTIIIGFDETHPDQSLRFESSWEELASSMIDSLLDEEDKETLIKNLSNIIDKLRNED